MKKHQKQVSKQTIETLISNTNNFRITDEGGEIKTVVGNINNCSLRITIIYYLDSVCFTNLISKETIHYKLT